MPARPAPPAATAAAAGRRGPPPGPPRPPPPGRRPAGRRRTAARPGPPPGRRPRPPTGRGGMLLGLGRGPPGRGPCRPGWAGPPGRARASRAAGRRARAALAGRPAGPAEPPGAGWPGRGAAPRGADPMPVAVELNGLLPGRGPGRGPAAWRGRGAGRGPGAAPGRPRSAAAAAAARAGPRADRARRRRPARRRRAGGTGPRRRRGTGAGSPAAGTAGLARGRSPVGGPARRAPGPAGWRGRRACRRRGRAGGTCRRAGRRPAARRAGLRRTGRCRRAARLAGRRRGAGWPRRPCALGAWAANASLSLRTTGASIVDDAERTNSPISWSLAITALLSTPNSLASSYTRTFATALPLLGPAPPGHVSRSGAARAPSGVSFCCSSPHAHRALITISACFPGMPLSPVLPSASARRRPETQVPRAEARRIRPPAARYRRARQHRAVRQAQRPRNARRRCAAQSIPGWDAGTHPGQASALRDRGRSRPRPPPSGASRTWPREPASYAGPDRRAAETAPASLQDRLAAPSTVKLTVAGSHPPVTAPGLRPWPSCRPRRRGASGRSPRAGPTARTALLRPSGAGLVGVGPDVDPPAGQPGGEPGVLALLADGQRELVVGHDHLRHPGLGVHARSPGTPGPGDSAWATNSAGSSE